MTRTATNMAVWCMYVPVGRAGTGWVSTGTYYRGRGSVPGWPGWVFLGGYHLAGYTWTGSTCGKSVTEPVHTRVPGYGSYVSRNMNEAAPRRESDLLLELKYRDDQRHEYLRGIDSFLLREN